jgi:hypothetical protein
MCLYQQYKYGPCKQRKIKARSNTRVKTVPFLMNELQLIQCRLAYNHVFQNPILAIHMPEKGKSSQLSLRTLKVELLQRLDADGFPCQVRI